MSETPAGLARVTGADFYAEQSYLHSATTMDCPSLGGATPVALSAAQLDADDTYAADNVSALASYDLVQIYTSGAWHLGGCQGGWFNCSSPFVAAAYTGVTVELDPFGVDTELRSGADGTLRPILRSGGTTPDSDGYFMRPTALEWPGQDLTDDANRTVWLPSEVIGLIGAVHFHHDMVDVSAWDVTLGCGVRALNIIGGGFAVAQPVICFV